MKNKRNVEIKQVEQFMIEKEKEFDTTKLGVVVMGLVPLVGRNLNLK